MKLTTAPLEDLSISDLTTLKRVAGRLKTQLEVGKRTTLNALVAFEEYKLIHACIVKRDVKKSVAKLEELIDMIDYWGDYKMREQLRNAKSNF